MPCCEGHGTRNRRCPRQATPGRRPDHHPVGRVSSNRPGYDDLWTRCRGRSCGRSGRRAAAPRRPLIGFAVWLTLPHPRIEGVFLVQRRPFAESDEREAHPRAVDLKGGSRDADIGTAPGERSPIQRGGQLIVWRKSGSRCALSAVTLHRFGSQPARPPPSDDPRNSPARSSPAVSTSVGLTMAGMLMVRRGHDLRLVPRLALRD